MMKWGLGDPGPLCLRHFILYNVNLFWPLPPNCPNYAANLIKADPGRRGCGGCVRLSVGFNRVFSVSTNGNWTGPPLIYSAEWRLQN
jgi:hypothetical protein